MDIGNLSMKASDALLLGCVDDGFDNGLLNDYMRGDYCRLCLTPYFERCEQ